jgi:hypothetical protein
VGTTATDEPHSIGLIGNVPIRGSVMNEPMKHPRSQLLWGTGTALAQDRLIITQDLGLHE